MVKFDVEKSDQSQNILWHVAGEKKSVSHFVWWIWWICGLLKQLLSKLCLFKATLKFPIIYSGREISNILGQYSVLNVFSIRKELTVNSMENLLPISPCLGTLH